MADDPGQARNPVRPLHQVVEAIYDVPLSGDWLQLQEALCAFWRFYDDTAVDARADLLRQLERHLDRMLLLLERGPQSDAPWREQLHRMPLAAALFSRDGVLVDANASAAKFLGLRPGQPDSRLDDAGQQIVREAIAALDRAGRGVTLVELPAGAGPPMRLMLSWFTQQEPVPLGPERLVLGVAVGQDPAADHAQLLGELYGLTPAESRLALRLAQGQSLDDAALALGIKKTTARTHLARSFTKLGVGTQHELVAVLLNSLFAVAQLKPAADPPKSLTPYLQPDLHGYAQFRRLTLQDGRTLGFFEYGVPDGPAVLYLHGTLDAGLLLLRASRQAAASGLRLLCVERGGVGESEPHADAHPNRYAEDLLELMNAQQLTRCVVAARSMGCWDALAFASRFAERVQGVVLASAKLPVRAGQAHGQALPFYRALYRGIWESPAIGRMMLQGMRLQLLLGGPERFLPEAACAAEQRLIEDPDYRRHMRAVWLRSALGGTGPLEALLRLYRQPLPEPPWRQFALPTLLVQGQEDTHSPLPAALAATADFRQREVLEVPDVGHRLVHLHFDKVLTAARRLWHLPGL